MNRAPKVQKLRPSKAQKVASKKPVAKVSKRTFRTSKPTRSALYTHQTPLHPSTAKESEDYTIESPHSISSIAQELFDHSAPIYAGPLVTRPGLGLGNLASDRKCAVTIYHPCKNAMQNEKNDEWKWKLREHRSRSDMTNQLVSDDYFTLNNQLFPKFATKELAIKYCELEGLEYVIEPEPVRKYDLRSYADNFKWKGPAVTSNDL